MEIGGDCLFTVITWFADLSYNQKAWISLLLYCVSVFGVLIIMYLQSFLALFVVRKTVGKNYFLYMNKPLVRKNTKHIFIVSVISFFSTLLLLKLVDLFNVMYTNNYKPIFKSSGYFDSYILVLFSIIFSFLISVISNYWFVLKKTSLSLRAKIISAFVIAAITLPLYRFFTWQLLGL